MQQFREVSRTRTIYSTETHTNDGGIFLGGVGSAWLSSVNWSVSSESRWNASRDVDALMRSARMDVGSSSQVCDLATNRRLWYDDNASDDKITKPWLLSQPRRFPVLVIAGSDF